MNPILEDAILGTDLNGDFHDLLNVNALVPVPLNLVAIDDPRLTEGRPPLPGSVTNDSVAADAGIVQSKLNLNGGMPPEWLGATDTTAAPGDLAEYVVRKNQINGYCGLDGGAKVLPAQLPGTTGTGTVTSIGMTVPSTFSITGSPITSAGTLAIAWAAAADQSWFGNKSGAPAAPQFYTSALPASLIPDLDAAKVVSGVFPPARLPVAVGLGLTHAPGAVPDPGDGSGGALATDYLARDMSYKAIPTIGPTYQPTIPALVLSTSDNITGPVSLTALSSVSGVAFFYSFTSAAAGFIEFPSTGYISVPVITGNQVWVYGAHPGYNNSAVATFTNTNPA